MVEFVLPADKAVPIIDAFDGSDLSAAACYKKFTQAGLKPQNVYKKTLAAGKNEFETSFEETGKGRKLWLELNFHRDELRKRIWAHGFVTPNYRIKEGQYGGELSLVGSGWTPGIIKLLSVVPDSLDTKEQQRVRVLFAKLSARDADIAALPVAEADKLTIGVFATEVTLPFREYERLAEMKLEAVELKKKLLALESAKITGLFGGETLDGGPGATTICTEPKIASRTDDHQQQSLRLRSCFTRRMETPKYGSRRSRRPSDRSERYCH